MRRYNLLVFDERIPSTSDVWSPADRGELVGRCDQLAFQAVIAQPDAGGTLTVQVEHSSDGVEWTNKNGSAELAGGTIGSGAVTPLWAAEAGTVPSLAQVRFRLTLGGGTTTAWVRLYVTCRDAGKV